jgi:hypothetical protein
MYPLLGNEVKELIDNHDNVKIIKVIKNRVFDWEKVTQLYNFVKNTQPNDWWVVADIDEFHLYPNDDLRKVVSNCDENGWDVVRGGFIDRIGEDGEFSEIKKDKQIFEQFPVMGFFRYPMSKACPNKICVMKGHIEITSGQHYAKIDGQTTWKWQGWNHPLIAPTNEYSVEVNHFKWDSTCIDRIKAVADINQTYSYSKEYKQMYYAIKLNNFKIDIYDERFMIEDSGELGYSLWKTLFKIIQSV